MDKEYLNLVENILINGHNKNTRNGTVKSIFGGEISHNMKNGFPLLTTKKMSWKTIVTELLWFLRGEDNIDFLLKNNCNIWNGDVYKKYENSYSLDFTNKTKKLSQEEFIEKLKTDKDFFNEWGQTGPIYGHNWRNYGGKIDQLKQAIDTLRTNPDSRRIIVNAWDPITVDEAILPPCHYSFQLYSRELTLYEKEEISNKIPVEKVPERSVSLKFIMRSTDVGLGLPFNLASYGLLLELIAKEVNMLPEKLVYSGGDIHIYETHSEGLSEQIKRSPYSLPQISIVDRGVSVFENPFLYTVDDFNLINYNYHPSIKLPLHN